MPDTYVHLPDGRYIRIPPDATPAQLDALRTRLRGTDSSSASSPGSFGLDKATGLSGPPKPTLGGDAPADAYQDPASRYLSESQNLTAEGEKASPFKALVGKVTSRASELGGMAGKEAGLLFGGPEGGEMASSFIPQKARAGANFEEVMSAARNVPVNAEKAGIPAMRLQELADNGGRPVNVTTKFMRRVTDPTKGPLTYKEARDFYTSARLSLNDMWGNPNKVQAIREVARFKQALGEAIRDAASSVDKGQTYADAMREYIAAMRMRKIGIGAGAVGVGKAVSQIPVVGPVVKGAVRGALGQ